MYQYIHIGIILIYYIAPHTNIDAKKEEKEKEEDIDFLR